MRDDLDEGLHVDVPEGGVHGPVVAATDTAVGHAGAEEDATVGDTDPRLWALAIAAVEEDHLKALAVRVNHEHAA